MNNTKTYVRAFEPSVTPNSSGGTERACSTSYSFIPYSNLGWSEGTSLANLSGKDLIRDFFAVTNATVRCKSYQPYPSDPRNYCKLTSEGVYSINSPTRNGAGYNVISKTPSQVTVPSPIPGDPPGTVVSATRYTVAVSFEDCGIAPIEANIKFIFEEVGCPASADCTNLAKSCCSLLSNQTKIFNLASVEKFARLTFSSEYSIDLRAEERDSNLGPDLIVTFNDIANLKAGTSIPVRVFLMRRRRGVNRFYYLTGSVKRASFNLYPNPPSGSTPFDPAQSDISLINNNVPSHNCTSCKTPVKYNPYTNSALLDFARTEIRKTYSNTKQEELFKKSSSNNEEQNLLTRLNGAIRSTQSNYASILNSIFSNGTPSSNPAGSCPPYKYTGYRTRTLAHLAAILNIKGSLGVSNQGSCPSPCEIKWEPEGKATIEGPYPP